MCVCSEPTAEPIWFSSAFHTSREGFEEGYLPSQEKLTIEKMPHQKIG